MMVEFHAQDKICSNEFGSLLWKITQWTLLAYSQKGLQWLIMPVFALFSAAYTSILKHVILSTSQWNKEAETQHVR